MDERERREWASLAGAQTGTEIWRGTEEELRRLKVEIGRLRAALADARDALRNDFEPDNQSAAWHQANNALTAKSVA